MTGTTPRAPGEAPAWATRTVEDIVDWVEARARGPVQLTAYSKTKLPDPTRAGRLIWVSDDATGAQVAVSNGAAWLRVNGLTPVA